MGRRRANSTKRKGSMTCSHDLSELRYADGHTNVLLCLSNAKLSYGQALLFCLCFPKVVQLGCVVSSAPCERIRAWMCWPDLDLHRKFCMFGKSLWRPICNRLSLAFREK